MATVGWIYLLKEKHQRHPNGKIYYKIGATSTATDLGKRFVKNLQIGNPVELKLLHTSEVDNSMDLSEALSDVSKGVKEILMQQICE